MFGLRADVRQQIDTMAGELGTQTMTSALAAQDLEAAVAEV